MKAQFSQKQIIICEFKQLKVIKPFMKHFDYKYEPFSCETINCEIDLIIFFHRYNNRFQSNYIFDYPSNLMIQNIIHPTLVNTHTQIFPQKKPSTILRQNINRLSLKFSSQKSSPLKLINLAIQNKKCKLLDVMKDQEFNKQEQVLQKYAPLKQSQKQLNQLIEYYKYYTQTSIIYQPLFFRLMHQYRQCKKEVQYNRLKIILHLSCTQNSEQNLQKSINSNFCSAQSLFILPHLNISLQGDQQSQVIVKLNSKLERNLGPNCFRTVQQLDRNYNFQKKRINNALDINFFKKITLNEKENIDSSSLKNNTKMHHKRNSCEQISIKKQIIKQSSLHKKKQLSMDNISNLAKQFHPKQRKPKIIQNTIRKSAKMRQKGSQEILLQQSSKVEDIKSKILDVKQKIQREKLQLKKKGNTLNNQHEMQKTAKKIVPAPPTEKRNKKITKFTFF